MEELVLKQEERQIDFDFRTIQKQIWKLFIEKEDFLNPFHRLLDVTLSARDRVDESWSIGELTQICEIIAGIGETVKVLGVACGTFLRQWINVDLEISHVERKREVSKKIKRSGWTESIKNLKDLLEVSEKTGFDPDYLLGSLICYEPERAQKLGINWAGR